jgi:hypothetical protein
VSTEIGAWGGAKFVRMIQRHLKRKQLYPDEGPAIGMPYEGIENLRPETKAAVQEVADPSFPRDVGPLKVGPQQPRRRSPPRTGRAAVVSGMAAWMKPRAN